MTRKNGIDIETQIIFLAMFWGGGGPYEISQIIHAYDWINRGIPTREELEIALNTLLSLELITMNEDKFQIPIDIGMDFDGQAGTPPFPKVEKLVLKPPLTGWDE